MTKFDPAFLDLSFFDRNKDGPYTKFEEALLQLVFNRPELRGLLPSQKISIAEMMREAGLAMLNQIEEGKK
jgi:hypothetical protein